MATVRFFAQARDAAGCKSATIEAETVGGVLEEACRRFGPALGRVLETSAIWLNGEFAERDEAVSAGDEVAILPPVSGG